MTAPVPGQGRLRVSQIVYCYDLTGASGPAIPLGVIADIRVGLVYGLGLKARKALSDQEAALVGQLARALVAQPFDMLLREFDAIWDGVDPEGSFEGLPARHPGSLQFSIAPVTVLPIPAILPIRAKTKPDILSQWTKDKLVGACDTGFWGLLEAHLPDDATSAERALRDRRLAA